MPEMFGVMAIANVLMIGLALFSDFGLNQNIVQSKRGEDPEFLNTVWTVQILRGLFLWFIALLVSSGLYLGAKNNLMATGSVYADPVLPLVLAVISFNAVISGFNATKLASALRLLAQRQLALIEIYCQIIGFATMIVWALIDRSIWCLVAGNIVSTFTKMVFSHLYLPGQMNRMQWNDQAVHEVVRFGKWIFLSSIIGFLLNNGDRLLLGGLIDSESLGVYSIAYMLVNVVQMAVTKLRTMVVFPALSEVVRERRHKLKEVYYKFRFWMDIVVLSLSGFFFVSGELIVQILYDDRYAAAGPMFQLLSLVLVAQRYVLADQCYLAMGKPNLMVFLILIRLASLFTLLLSGFYLYGMNGAIGGIVLSSYVSIPASLYLKHKHGILDMKKELNILWVFALGMVVGFVFTWIF